MKVTIGIPAFNEEKNIAGIILKLKKISDDIIVCDDGSNDLTGQIAEKFGADVVKHEKAKQFDYQNNLEKLLENLDSLKS